MFVVVVEFNLYAEFAAAFIERVKQQAADSLRLESGCRAFDVCLDPADENFVLLYEVYTDKNAFDAHLASSHYENFSAEVLAWVGQKKVSTYQRIEAPQAK